MNIFKKNIIGLLVVSCLILTACGSTSTTTQEEASADNTTIQDSIQNDVEDDNTDTEQIKEDETTEIEETTQIVVEEEVINTVDTEEITSEGTESTDHLTASDVLEILKANNSNIGTYIEYTEETDTNNLLGRPNQYISKINGADNRIEQTDESNPKGFSIEVFTTHEDALARQEYINAIGEKMPMMVEYNYVNDYILLRVNKDLTPTEAEEYEAILNSITP